MNDQAEITLIVSIFIIAAFIVFILIKINTMSDHPKQSNTQQHNINYHNDISDKGNIKSNQTSNTPSQILKAYNNLQILKEEIDRDGEDDFAAAAVILYTKAKLDSNSTRTIKDLMNRAGFSDKDAESTILMLRKIELLVGDQQGSTQLVKWTNFSLNILAVSIALCSPIADCGKEFISRTHKLLLKALSPDVAKMVLSKAGLIELEQISNKKLQAKSLATAEISLYLNKIPENKLQLILVGYMYIYAFEYIWNIEHNHHEDDNNLEKFFSDLEPTCSSVVFYSNDYKTSTSTSNIVNKSRLPSVIKNIEWLNSQKQDVFGIRVHSYMDLAYYLKSLNSGELLQSDMTELVSLINNAGTVISLFKLLKKKRFLQN